VGFHRRRAGLAVWAPPVLGPSRNDGRVLEAIDRYRASGLRTVMRGVSTYMPSVREAPDALFSSPDYLGTRLRTTHDAHRKKATRPRAL